MKALFVLALMSLVSTSAFAKKTMFLECRSKDRATLVSVNIVGDLDNNNNWFADKTDAQEAAAVAVVKLSKIIGIDRSKARAIPMKGDVIDSMAGPGFRFKTANGIELVSSPFVSEDYSDRANQAARDAGEDMKIWSHPWGNGYIKFPSRLSVSLYCEPR